MNGPTLPNLPGATASSLLVSAKTTREPRKCEKSGKIYCNIGTYSKTHALPDQALLRPASAGVMRRYPTQGECSWTDFGLAEHVKIAGAVHHILLRPAEAAALACLSSRVES